MTPMELIRSLQPEQYQALCDASACGCWPDGRRLTAEQQQTVMQTILLYQANANTQEAFTVQKDGEVVRQLKSPRDVTSAPIFLSSSE